MGSDPWGPLLELLQPATELLLLLITERGRKSGQRARGLLFCAVGLWETV